MPLEIDNFSINGDLSEENPKSGMEGMEDELTPADVMEEVGSVIENMKLNFTPLVRSVVGDRLDR
ncbi:MAG: hypothetical protein H6581_15805 [Bacteroidia bacterium]|nr:hypothetical protein [Bacteroidia bacterium]